MGIGVVSFGMGSKIGEPETAQVTTEIPADTAEVRVTGIGGVFFHSQDPTSLLKWYRAHLGIDYRDWGGFPFHWREEADPSEIGYTIWTPFPDSTSYFSPSEHPYMINYRVADLSDLMASLREEGVEIVGEIAEYPNGKFAWILDPEGRKIELWEPVPSSKDPYLK